MHRVKLGGIRNARNARIKLHRCVHLIPNTPLKVKRIKPNTAVVFFDLDIGELKELSGKLELSNAVKDWRFSVPVVLE